MLVSAYRFLNLLSIDIAIGAIAGALYFARLLEVQMRVAAIVSLGLTVWIIYTVDHLMDAKKLKGRASTERHRFHQDHFRSLVMFVVVAILINGVLIFFIKRPVLYAGVVIIALVAFYLLLHSQLAFLKEIFVALLYCTGILLPSVAVTELPITHTQLGYFISFFLMALINLLLFSWFDKEKDEADNHKSFVTQFGAIATMRIIITLIGVNFILSVCLLTSSKDIIASIIPLSMTLAYLVIVYFRSWFAIDARFRLLGDAVFLMPLIATVS